MINAFVTKIQSKKGDFGIDAFLSILVYLLTFATLMLALVYVLQVYNACYVCRRVVRDIEVRGQYDAAIEEALASQLGAGALDGLTIEISDVSYFEGDETAKKIQLQESFVITLTAHYDIKIASFNGKDPIEMQLPITISLKGYSEKYWKPTS